MTSAFAGVGENIKNAVIKLAMPIRRNFSICEYRYYCLKNDSKFK